MFSFIIMLSTLSCLLPYLFSSLSELALYLRGKKPFTKIRLIHASLITIPAFFYAVWAVTGLEYEVIIWGLILLAAGIPIYIWVKFRGGGSE
jgi:APA family basic amino acid/polyamine antiporter